MDESLTERIDQVQQERAAFLEAMRESIRREARRYAADGQLMATWRDGHVVWVDPVTHLEVLQSEPIATAQ
jgi:hypothetical protein